VEQVIPAVQAILVEPIIQEVLAEQAAPVMAMETVMVTTAIMAAQKPHQAIIQTQTFQHLITQIYGT
jgi:hypothetical protein